MMSFVRDAMALVSRVLSAASAGLFCCVLSVFVLPAIVDRLAFYLPRLILLHHRKEVLLRGIVRTVLEVLMWIGIPCAAYAILYVFRPALFRYALTSIPARIAWVIGAVHLLLRSMQFERVILPQFYTSTYLRCTTPQAMQAYRRFLTELNALSASAVEDLLNTRLPYLQRQAAQKKLMELR